MKFKRREFLKQTSLITAASLLPGAVRGFTLAVPEGKQPATQKSFVISEAVIHSMDPVIGDLENASIYVSDGEIIEIGETIDVPHGIEIIDGKNCIVMPGLIDCHWHLWTSLLRSMAGTEKGEGYFIVTERYSKHFTREDMKIAATYAAAEAINSGITTLCDFNHNARSPEYVLASLEGLAEAGIRAKTMYGGYRDKPEAQSTNFKEIEEVLAVMRRTKSFELLSLGLGSRGASYEHLERDWKMARELGLAISIHASSNSSQVGHIKLLSDKNLLNRDVNIIHANAITPAEVAAVAKAGANITSTPFTEMRIGFGLARPNELVDAGINVALGIDTTSLSGNADMFAVMKIMQNLANARAENEFYISPQQIMEMATINGAKTLGLEKSVGSLAPGKRADLIMINKNGLNFSTGIRSKHLVVEATQPQNVQFVSIDGEILKRNGTLTNIDAEKIVAAATNSFQRIHQKVIN